MKSKRRLKNEDENGSDDGSEDEYQERSDYFQDVSIRIKKSDKTLKNLDLSFLKADKNYLKKDSVQEIVNSYYEKELFSKIYSLSIHNSNVILTGQGSRKSLLESFKSRWLMDEKFLSIYGYFLELNLKVILIKLSKLFDIESTNENDFYERAPDLKKDIFLIIHSMDILFKTDAKIKNFFINLYTKSKGKVHLIATVDHVNAALMFNQKDEQKLNLVCLEATTYKSYEVEKRYLNSIDSNKNKKSLMGLDAQTLTMNSITSVYNSLPANSQKVLMFIFKEWIEYLKYKNLNKKAISGSDDKGLLHSRILYKCREQFIVNSDNSFKHLLNEFKDHDLIQLVRSGNANYIVVLIEEHIITKFMNEIENPAS